MINDESLNTLLGMGGLGTLGTLMLFGFKFLKANMDSAKDERDRLTVQLAASEVRETRFRNLCTRAIAMYLMSHAKLVALGAESPESVDNIVNTFVGESNDSAPTS